jgi:hypothetical protein
VQLFEELVLDEILKHKLNHLHLIPAFYLLDHTEQMLCTLKIDWTIPSDE